MSKYRVYFIFMLFLFVSCTNENRPGIATHDDMQRWLDAWNSHNIDTIKLLFADSALIYQPQNPKPLTINNLASFFTMVFATYPDIHFGKEGVRHLGSPNL